MRIETLEACRVDEDLLSEWKKTVGRQLLPVQERAVRAFATIDPHFLVLAPTSSGMTFIGEMAALTRLRPQGKARRQRTARANAKSRK